MSEERRKPASFEAGIQRQQWEERRTPASFEAGDPRGKQQPHPIVPAVLPSAHPSGPHTVVPIVQPSKPLPSKQPCLDLLEGRRVEYIKYGLPLYEAAIEGDWKAAKDILDAKPGLIRCAITENNETLLHVAASAESTKAVEEFVKNLVQLMEKEDLELQSKFLSTALSLAAAAGNIETAKTMVEKNLDLINIPSEKRMMPLYLAAYFAKPAMVRYLYGISNKMTGEYWSDDNRGLVIEKCVEAEIFDVAIKIVHDRPELTVNKELLTNVLLALAQKTDALNGTKPHSVFGFIKSLFHVKLGPFEEENEALQLLRIIWGKIAEMSMSEIDEILQGWGVKIDTGPKSAVGKENEIAVFAYPSRVLFFAVKMGNTRFIVELLRLYPDLVWKRDDKGKTIFHLAIKRRQIEIYKLLYEIGAMINLILITHAEDKNHNNMLHMVAKSAKQNRLQNVSGVAFQMQRELLWFEEVEKIIPPNLKDKKNKDGKTARDLFTRHMQSY